MKKYDSTIARIAGNIASGLATVPDPRTQRWNADAVSIAEWERAIATVSVSLARAIVEEVKRTEPQPEPVPELPEAFR